MAATAMAHQAETRTNNTMNSGVQAPMGAIGAAVAGAGSFSELKFTINRRAATNHGGATGSTHQQPMGKCTVALHGFLDSTNSNLECNFLFIVDEVRGQLTCIQAPQSKHWCKPQGDPQLVRNISKATAVQLKTLKSNGHITSKVPQCNLCTWGGVKRYLALSGEQRCLTEIEAQLPKFACAQACSGGQQWHAKCQWPMPPQH